MSIVRRIPTLDLRYICFVPAYDVRAFYRLTCCEREGFPSSFGNVRSKYSAQNPKLLGSGSL